MLVVLHIPLLVGVLLNAEVKMCSTALLSNSIYPSTSQLLGSSQLCRDSWGQLTACSWWRPSVGGVNGGVNGGATKIGNGYYNVVQGTHAELVCDFLRDAGFSAQISNVIWRKVEENPGFMNSPALASINNIVDSTSFSNSPPGAAVVRLQSSPESLTPTSFSSGNRRLPWIPRQPGIMASAWNSASTLYPWSSSHRTVYPWTVGSDRYFTSARVYTHGSRSTLYLRNFRVTDQGRYRCVASSPGMLGAASRTVFMDVDFFPNTMY